MILHIGWKTWMVLFPSPLNIYTKTNLASQVFGTMNALAFIFTLFMPETKGLSLEEMDILFRVVDESTRRQDIEEHIGGVSEKMAVSATVSVPGTPEKEGHSEKGPS